MPFKCYHCNQVSDQKTRWAQCTKCLKSPFSGRGFEPIDAIPQRTKDQDDYSQKQLFSESVTLHKRSSSGADKIAAASTTAGNRTGQYSATAVAYQPKVENVQVAQTDAVNPVVTNQTGPSVMQPQPTKFQTGGSENIESVLALSDQIAETATAVYGHMPSKIASLLNVYAETSDTAAFQNLLAKLLAEKKKRKSALIEEIGVAAIAFFSEAPERVKQLLERCAATTELAKLESTLSNLQEKLQNQRDQSATAVTTPQSTMPQGTTSQGTTSQGTTSQGTTSQGTTSQGTTSPSTVPKETPQTDSGAKSSAQQISAKQISDAESAAAKDQALALLSHPCLQDILARNKLALELKKADSTDTSTINNLLVRAKAAFKDAIKQQLANENERDLAVKSLNADQQIFLLEDLQKQSEKERRSMLEMLYKSAKLDKQFMEDDNQRRESVLKAIKTSTELNKHKDNWENLSAQERFQAMRQAFEIQCTALGFKKDEFPPFKMRAAKDNDFTNENGKIKVLQGQFKFGSGELELIDHKDGPLRDFDCAINTVIHEMTHGYQHYLMERLKATDDSTQVKPGVEPLLKNDPRYKQAKVFALNHDMYLSVTKDASVPHDVYENQPLERHAHKAGNEAEFQSAIAARIASLDATVMEIAQRDSVLGIKAQHLVNEVKTQQDDPIVGAKMFFKHKQTIDAMRQESVETDNTEIKEFERQRVTVDGIFEKVSEALTAGGIATKGFKIQAALQTLKKRRDDADKEYLMDPPISRTQELFLVLQTIQAEAESLLQNAQAVQTVMGPYAKSFKATAADVLAAIDAFKDGQHFVGSEQNDKDLQKLQSDLNAFENRKLEVMSAEQGKQLINDLKEVQLEARQLMQLGAKVREGESQLEDAQEKYRIAYSQANAAIASLLQALKVAKLNYTGSRPLTDCKKLTADQGDITKSKETAKSAGELSKLIQKLQTLRQQAVNQEERCDMLKTLIVQFELNRRIAEEKIDSFEGVYLEKDWSATAFTAYNNLANAFNECQQIQSTDPAWLQKQSSDLELMSNALVTAVKGDGKELT